MICLFSMPRSGSTWLGKIFDSHPDVLYLHEPGLVDRGMDILPYWFDGEPSPEQVEAARLYLDRMMRVRSARATGTRPFFRKNYRSWPAERARRALIYAGKGAEQLYGRELTVLRRIPDFADRGRPATTVMKLVSGLGRAEVLLRAAGGNMKPALILRHPCGYVSSMIRGSKSGKMSLVSGLGRLLHTRTARQLGIDPATFRGSDVVETLAWNWLLSNGEAYDAITEAGGEIIVYERVAEEPVSASRALFSAVGLDWAPECESFLRRSTSRQGGYYSVYRNASQSAASWRERLDEKTVGRIRDIVERAPVGQMFF